MTQGNVVGLFDEPTQTDPVVLKAKFEEFWAACPKKVGKPVARAKFLEIVTTGLKTQTLDRDSGKYVIIELEATPDELIEGMKAYRDTQIDRDNGYALKDGGKYTCMPATFLNQGRWEDG